MNRRTGGAPSERRPFAFSRRSRLSSRAARRAPSRPAEGGSRGGCPVPIAIVRVARRSRAREQARDHVDGAADRELARDGERLGATGEHGADPARTELDAVTKTSAWASDSFLNSIVRRLVDGRRRSSDAGSVAVTRRERGERERGARARRARAMCRVGMDMGSPEYGARVAGASEVRARVAHDARCRIGDTSTPPATGRRSAEVRRDRGTEPRSMGVRHLSRVCALRARAARPSTHP